MEQLTSNMTPETPMEPSVPQRFGPPVFDLWIFHRQQGEPRYLMLLTSQEKADRWFGGGRFWQICGDFYTAEESTIEAIQRHLRDLKLTPVSAWCSEYVYTIYNRRFDALQFIPVFAAEIEGPVEIDLSWHHSEAGWFTAAECLERINFWGLEQGLAHTRRFVTEHPDPPKEFRLF
jgi:hypothetical protein